MARVNGFAALDLSRRTTLGMLERFPDDQYFFQPFDGANHVQWITGHIAWADDYFLAGLGARPATLPQSWTDACGYGSKLSTNPARIPSMGDIKDRLASLREEFRNYFKSLDADRLAAPLPQKFKDFAPNHAGMMSAAACHEMMHAGQITMIRRALGLPRVFG